jgi:hypothetical protein
MRTYYDIQLNDRTIVKRELEGEAIVKAGRYFIGEVRKAVTTSERWAEVDSGQTGQFPPRPAVAVNIGLSFRGLLALELPTRTLQLLPHEFIEAQDRRKPAQLRAGGGRWKRGGRWRLGRRVCDARRRHYSP